MTDVDECASKLEPGLSVYKLRYVNTVGAGEDGDLGGAPELIDDGGLLQRARKLGLFLECPVITSSLGRESDVTSLLDVTALLTRLSTLLLA